MEITHTKNIPDKDIANLLDEAGRGARYWCEGAERLEYETMTTDLLNGARTLKLKDAEADKPTIYTLDLKAIKRGLEVMAEKFPTHFADVLTENDDDNTGDVFLQCALLGNVIYG